MDKRNNQPDVRQELVSVIIPAYNAEPFLAEALDSVLASTYPHIEIIVVNDGSKDKTLDIAQTYEKKDERIRVIDQPNAGVCHARNNAIRASHGEYILPVDADNKIEPHFITEAVNILKKDADVKGVIPRADFFGDRSGEWLLPPFSIRLLARKNIIDTCGMYRRADWEKTGGYCAEIIAREDWDFWISMLKNGGRVVKTADFCLHYRFQKKSKRTSDRLLKDHVIKTLNKRHPEFFERELNGPLHLHRTWSRLLNNIHRFFHPRKIFLNPKYADKEFLVKALPSFFENQQGKLIHDGRNKLREFQWGDITVVVKSYQTPHLINRIAYGLFRSSKAQRSYEYADLLRSKHIGSPEPVAWMTERNGLLFTRSYFVSLKSTCPYSYNDLIGGKFPEQEKYLRAIARTTAALHENGMLHKDYSRGNILFGDNAQGVAVEIIDLNRIRFHSISQDEGCRNFAERLPATDEMRHIMAEEYAKARHFDSKICEELMATYNVEKS